MQERWQGILPLFKAWVVPLLKTTDSILSWAFRLAMHWCMKWCAPQIIVTHKEWGVACGSDHVTQEPQNVHHLQSITHTAQTMFTTELYPHPPLLPECVKHKAPSSSPHSPRITQIMEEFFWANSHKLWQLWRFYATPFPPTHLHGSSWHLVRSLDSLLKNRNHTPIMGQNAYRNCTHLINWIINVIKKKLKRLHAHGTG